MVQKGIELATWVKVHLKSSWGRPAIYMENPVGSLQYQEYIKDWERTGDVERKMVHYCHYDHYYHKPTHIWTNMRKLREGRCGQRCKYGFRNYKGKWEHKYKIAQGSRQAKGGQGRKAFKNMMPCLLHKGLVQAALKL